MKYEAIILDFDGVLIDSMNIKTNAFATLFKSYGEEVVKKVIDYHIHNGGVSRTEKFKYFYKNFLNKDINEEEMTLLCTKFAGMVLNQTINAPWIEGAQEFLEANYKKIPLYVVSGIPDSELRLIIKKRKMEKYFKGVYGYPPDKFFILNTIIARNYYNKPKILYIGDTLGDWEIVQEVGINFIGLSKEQKFPNNVKTIPNFTKGIE